MKWLRDHSLLLSLFALGLLCLVFFTWCTWHTYLSDSQQHHQHALFWSKEFLWHWGDNAAQNWQSEILFGGVVILLLRKHARERGVEE